MRRSVIAIVAVVGALLAGAAPVQAAEAGAHGGWVPAPQGGYEQPAGARCDFAVRSEPVLDEVRKLVLDSYPDGSPKRELYAGDLIVKFTNLETGVSKEFDASGTAMIDYGTDGSMTWYVVGPAIFGFRADGSSLPRGIWVIDGVYTMAFTPTFQKTLTMVHGTTDNVCTHLD
ncbi:hypothetical protein ACFQZ4_02775 [Catellatospora coxensis]|uniref:Allene oxide cyclase barrel-like domain-containing protein n=1 Tax=Catellatospora coxensis TaxID=310354 RepID=A0A8J3KZ70_9ACTN|nr:hypothetical protein [Catellatospora coxensis]GIG04780.1 hypothetical protein Cco03nite_14800 [Catellatospora coxensis]